MEIRFDQRAGEIDQMPFGIGFIDSATVGSGVLVQHGNWEHRTTSAPSGFYERVAASGLGTVYPLTVLPSSNSGMINELFISKTGHHDAFKNVVNAIRMQTEESDEEVFI